MSEVPRFTVYVINLDSRPDRWESIKKICYSCGITPERVSAVKESPGWIGCAKSHQKVASLAESKGEPWYVVLEDDATFSNDDWKRFIELLPKLWSIRDTWDIFNGGTCYMNTVEVVQTSPPLIRAQGVLTHFLLVNSNGYPILNRWTPEGGHVDEYFKVASRMIITYPFIAGQLPGSSDIGIGDPVQCYKEGQEHIKKILVEQNILEQFYGFNSTNQRAHWG